MKLIENWTEVRGEILSIRKSGIKDFHEILLRISAMNTYENYPNLLASYSLSEITLSLQSAVVKELHLKTGDKIRALVRVAPNNNYFIKPDSVEVMS